MKAMVLCAGLGTRLGELTRELPKPLLEVAGRPLLEYILRNLGRNGFSEIVINVHFAPEILQSAFGDGSSLGVRLHYSFEPELLGTAGGVKNVESQFADESEFLVHYGDIITNQNFAEMVAFHREKNALCTILVHRREKSNSSVGLDADNRVIEFLERPDSSYWETPRLVWVNSGIMLFSPEVLQRVPTAIPCDWPRDIFPSLVQTGRLFAFPLSGYRVAVDSPDRLEQVRRDMENGVFIP